jgi:hypothetical protein
MAGMWARRRLLAKISDEVELTRQAVDRSGEEIRLSRESREDIREFMRELTLRNERVFRDLSAGIRETLNEVREGREEQRAQTQALLRLIDRMDRLDPGGAAA